MRESRFHPGRVNQHDPFPTGWIGRLNDLVLDALVFHRRAGVSSIAQKAL
jgi:hypothetical protein